METTDKIAIIGAAVRFPGSRTLARFWQNLAGAQISVREGPPHADDPAFVPRFGSIEGRDDFDYAFFGINLREAEFIDPQQRLLLECGWALREALGPGGLAGRVTGVFVGTSISTYLHNALRRPLVLNGEEGFQAMLGCDKDLAASRLSYKLGFTGPSLVVQTACSTSLVAVHLACQSVLAGESDVAFAGGASVQWVPRHGHVHVPGHIYSEDGYCRAFDRRATGTVFGDGAGLVALKRLDLALADGDDILAVIRGTAVNNSGATAAGFTAPSYHAQKALLEQAYANADVDPAEVGLLEAHGTGTHLGDPIEFAALKDVFEQAGARPAQCALGALKANLGHLAAAAGIAGLIKVALCLRQGAIVPHPLFEASHPDIALDESPFYINTKTEAWPGPAPRFAGVSSFGLGGSNAHAVLESAPPRPPTVANAAAAARHHVTLSAPTPDLLDIYRQDLLEHLTAFADVDPADVAFTLGQRAERFPSRLHLSFSGRDELLARLAAASPAAAAFTKPAGAEAHPDGPEAHPDRIGADPDRLGAHPDGVGAHPDRVGAHPDRIGADPDRVGAHPDRVKAHPDRIGVDPDGVEAHTEAAEAKPPAGRTVLLPVPRLRPTPASLAPSPADVLAPAAPIAADVPAPVASTPAEVLATAAPEASPRRPKVLPAASAMAAAPASPAPTLLKQIALMRLQLLALRRRGAA